MYNSKRKLSKQISHKNPINFHITKVQFKVECENKENL